MVIEGNMGDAQHGIPLTIMELNHGHLCTSQGIPQAPAVGWGHLGLGGDHPSQNHLLCYSWMTEEAHPISGFPGPPTTQRNESKCPWHSRTSVFRPQISPPILPSSTSAHILTLAQPGGFRSLGSSTQSQVFQEQILRKPFSTSAPLTFQAKYSLLQWGLNMQHSIPVCDDQPYLQMQPGVSWEAKSTPVEKNCPKVCLVST